MAAIRASFGDLLEPGFRKIYDDVYAEIPEQFSTVLHVNTSDKQDEKDSAVTGFGMLQETAEGAPIDYEDPLILLAAYGSNIIGKFLKLRGKLTVEFIRNQITKLRDLVRGSETVIGTSLAGWWDSPNYTATYRVR